MERGDRSGPRVREFADLATPAGTVRVLRAFEIHPRKALGQHFLVSHRALDRILDAADLRPDDRVVEVGAGIGTLTVALARRAGSVVAVELDRALLPALAAATDQFPNVRVVHADAMRVPLAALFEGAPEGRRNVVANLPFNVASPLVMRFLREVPGLARMVVTVQQEVAERIVARPGGRQRGILSVLVQLHADPAIVSRLSRSAFLPQPEVTSAVVRLDVRPAPVDVDDEAFFTTVVEAAFGQRRKTIRNALAGSPALGLAPVEAERALAAAAIDPGRRGETVTLGEFARLAAALRDRRGR